MFLSSSRAKSNGILIIGVRKSHAAKFRISRLDEVRKFLALIRTTETKMFPTELRTKIRRYNIIFEILNSIFSKLAVSSWYWEPLFGIMQYCSPTAVAMWWLYLSPLFNLKSSRELPT